MDVTAFSDDELLQILSHEIGFRFEVPDIMTFLHDDYFLGGKYWDKEKRESRIYPYWEEKLQELYPNPITTASSYVVTTGAIGTGKSTFSQIMLMYDYTKLLAMRNPGSFFRLINLNGIRLFGCNLYKYKAIEFVNPVLDLLESAPFIKDLKKQGEFNDNIQIQPANGMKSIVSTDAAFIWLSEINEYKGADELISAALSRMNGRFRRGLGTFCHFVLDCSDTMVDSPTERFIHQSEYSDKVYVVQPNVWTAKPFDYWHMEPKGFKVYGGDSVVSPHILKQGEDTSKMDQDRILEVPMELHSEFSMNIHKALQEKAGLSLISGGMFFPDDHIKNYFKIPQIIKEVVEVDFYDDTQLMDLDGMIETVDSLLPEDKYIFVGIDAGYATDQFGIAIGYVESSSYVKISDNLEEKELKDYYIKIPIVFGVGRLQGQQTNLTKVRNFFFALNEKHPIHTLVHDSFESTFLSQEMKMIGIKTRLLSVETDKYYLPFKHSLCEGKIELPNNNLLYREFRCLRNYDGKIDHSNIEVGDEHMAQKTGVNAKDMADAVVRCFSIMRENLTESLDIPLGGNGDYNSSFMLDIYKNLEILRVEQQNIQRYMKRCGGQ